MSGGETRRPRIGIIGCGQIVAQRHAPELATCEDAVVAGFYDLSAQRAEEFAQRYGGRAYPTHQAMLEDAEVDAVVVCTANNTHAPLSLEAMQAGKHVLCEKPTATTVDDARAMAKAAAERPRQVCMAAHNQRYTFAHQTAHRLIHSGEMGRVLSFRCTLGHPGPENFSVNRSTGTWYLNKAASGFGCISDLGIHKIDVLMHILGEGFTLAAAQADTLDKKAPDGTPAEVYDNACCLLRTASGVMGTLNLMYTNYGLWDNSTTYFCEKGTVAVHYDATGRALCVKKNGEQVTYTPKPEEPPRSGIMDAFAGAIRRSEKSPVPFAEALRALEVIFAIAASAESGTFQAIAQTKDA